MKSLSNISVRDFRKALAKLGLEQCRTMGGHEAWMKEGMSRPVIFQSHVNPIPEFVVRNNLRTVGITKEDFLALFEEH